jgi:hypothetical protein
LKDQKYLVMYRRSKIHQLESFYRYDRKVKKVSDMKSFSEF